MPQVNSHEPGSFCWIELATSDQNAAKAFYSSVFGWDFDDSPMGPGEFYTMFKLRGLNVGAAYTQHGEEVNMGVPPHWNLYIQVQNADKTTAQAAALGAKVLAGPFDVMSYGRMAVISDPQGAVFCVWETKDHTGIQVKNEHGAFCWADLNSPGAAAGAKFYGDLFGWTFVPGEGGYLHIKNGESFIGGIPAEMPPNAPPHWMIYLQTDDCDATLAKATQAGANVCMPPTTMENVGRFGVLADPQNATFAIFTPMAPA